MSTGNATLRKLTLYVAGETPKSLAAISNLDRICREHLPGKHQIVAIPTLMRELPVPIRKIIGDLSDEQKVLVNLKIE